MKMKQFEAEKKQKKRKKEEEIGQAWKGKGHSRTISSQRENTTEIVRNREWFHKVLTNFYENQS